ncbi:hypothetical protein GF373_03385, partial [bacterium]|nr:hypothetical protein [bacterium]
MYKTIFPILFLLAVTTATARADFFVSINGSDGDPGTREEPFATLERAREAVREMKPQAVAGEAIHVWLREGNYVLREPLEFTPRDSGTPDSPIIYAAHGGEEVTLSGGTNIEGWKHIEGNLWKTQLPAGKAGEWYFRQLFADGRRLTRARIPNEGYLYTEGPLSKYAEPDKRRHGWNYSVIGGMRKNQPEVFCGFSFKPGDIHAWENYKDAEVITYHSWECSWQTIREIDSENNDVYFNTPCRYPVGFFSDHARYRIENIPSALDEAGEWYLNRETGELSYLAHAGQDPRSMEFVAPRLKRFLTLRGEAERQKFVEHIEFRDITFRYARYPMGIYDVAPDWPEPARKAHGDWSENFPPGYTDSQASPRCGQAIDLIAARNCIFRDCEVSHVGAYAISLGRDCHNNTVYGCHL